MEHQQEAHPVRPASVPVPPVVGPAASRGPAATARAVARAVVPGATRVLLAAGAVVAAGELVRDLGPGPALVVLVALGTVGNAVVAVWQAMAGPLRLEDVTRGGAWTGCALVAGTLAVTSGTHSGPLLSVLAVLALLQLRLDRG